MLNFFFSKFQIFTFFVTHALPTLSYLLSLSAMITCAKTYIAAADHH